MAKPGKSLETFRFPEGTCIPQAQPKTKGSIAWDTPAETVMTDLTKVRAATISPGMLLAPAEQAMIHQGVRMLFVVEHMPCVEGVVTSDALDGELPLMLAQERRVKRGDLTVEDVMTKLSELDAIDYDALCKSTVADVVATMHAIGRAHLVVVQAATKETPGRIRGLISHTQIERRLGESIPLLKSGSYSKIGALG